MQIDLETGSIVVTVVSMVVLGFGLWIIKKMGEI